MLAEYLVGGLSLPRLRVLAARVVAAQRLLAGDDFKSAFAMLVDERGFTPAAAFDVVTRIYQSGGLMKDLIYLRGLFRLMEYLRSGGELEPLFIGKIAEKHVRIVRELQERRVLKPLPLLPRYLEQEESCERLQRVRNGLSIIELIETGTQ